MRYLRSWVVVFSLLLLLVLVCVFWKRLSSPHAQPVEAQFVDNPEPALAAVRPSVVGLWVTKRTEQGAHVELLGPGLIVDPRGYVLTSATVTPEVESLYVIDAEENKHRTQVVATDKRTHLTLLKADPIATITTSATMQFEAARLGDSDRIRSGDGVVALGGRMTPSSWELTTKTGQITRPSQSLIVARSKYRHLIQTDISLEPENSGGPLVNMRGEVIGFCLPSVRPSNDSYFGYAAPINQGKEFLARLPIPQWSEGTREIVCTWLGAETLPVNPVIGAQFSVPDRRGEIVNQVAHNSPADRAGLRRGDVITSVNGQRITDRPTFDEMAAELCETKWVRVTILRNGHEKNLTLYWDTAAYALPRGGSLVEVVLVVLVFSLMYYLAYMNRCSRVLLFVLGAIAVAVLGHYLGFYTREQIALALLSKLDVLCLLVGMQVVVGVLDEAGALEHLGKKIALASGGNHWRIMWLFCLLTYGFSMVANNLTTIVVMAPLVLNLSKHMDYDPKPFLVSMVIASNLGGASTMIGDFPNMLIGAETGLTFSQFALYMLPICLLELFVLMLYLRLFVPSFSGSGVRGADASPGGARSASSAPDAVAVDLLTEMDLPELGGGNGDRTRERCSFLERMRESLPQAIKNPKAVRRGLIILATVIAGFFLCGPLRCSPAIIALAGGAVALAFGTCEPLNLLRKVGFKDLLFFSSLFVLVGAAEASGMLNYISGALVDISFGNVLVLCLLLMWSAAFVTCFLNAGPTTALFLPVVLSLKSAAPHHLYWWALSLGVCAGSSGTLSGATAGSIAATMVDRFRRKESHEPASLLESNRARFGTLTFREYARLGVPMMFIFLFISTIYIMVIYRW